jgi:hypothetical protein
MVPSPYSGPRMPQKIIKSQALKKNMPPAAGMAE